MRIGVHDGAGHADDAIAAAVLCRVFPGAEVIRTRMPTLLAQCDILADVGGEYDPDRNRFDHHQAGFAECRPQGYPYAAAGLVWKVYGANYVAGLCPKLTREQHRTIAEQVDRQLICFADAVDSGVSIPGPIEFGLAAMVSNFNATWTDDATLSDDMRFVSAQAFVGTVLQNLVRTLAAELEAAALVRQAPRIEGGRVLVLDTPRVPFNSVICAEMPDVQFVVYPDSGGESYQVRVVPVTPGAFVARKDLPATWAGLRDTALAAVTGVPDAIFAHNGRFICGAASKEGALEMARQAVAAYPAII